QRRGGRAHPAGRALRGNCAQRREQPGLTRTRREVASNNVSRGILGWGSYLPYRRLDRSTIAAVAGAGGGKGTRTVASFDEDTTTLGVESARQVLRALPD